MFWERYESLCKKVDKKPSRVAAEIGFSSTMVTKYKNGAIPNGDILVKIADYFSVTVDYLLGHDSISDDSVPEEDKSTMTSFTELSDTDKRLVSDLIKSLKNK